MEVKSLKGASCVWTLPTLALLETCSRITSLMVRAGKNVTVLFHTSESEYMQVLHIST